MLSLEREEIRKFICKERLNEFLDYLLKEGYKEIVYSKKRCTQTIYLDNLKYPLPFNISLKLRRYIIKPKEKIKIEKNAEYIFEKKETFFRKRILLKKKKRYLTKGSKILKKLNSFNLSEILYQKPPKKPEKIDSFLSGIFLKPLMATQYYRRHFRKRYLRITIDSETDFFTFDKTNKAHKIGKNKFIVVELKIFGGPGRKESKKVLKKLEQLNALNSVSKKCFCSNKLATHIQKKLPKEYKLFNEIPKEEFEIKFNIKKISSGFLFLILRFLFDKDNQGFVVCPEQKFSKEIGTIQRYYKKNGNIEKISYAGDIFTKSSKIIFKNEKEILRRKEFKDRSKNIFSDGKLNSNFFYPSKEFHRIRKSFWIVNQSSGRVYKIAVDDSYTEKNLLNQLEIEYSGIRKGKSLKNPKEEIKKDLNKLKKILVNSDYISGYLEPTRLTKLNWLKSFKKF